MPSPYTGRHVAAPAPRESRLLHDIRDALCSAADHRGRRCRVVRNQVGFTADPRPIRYGLGVGSPDLVGVLRGGVAFAVEVKTASGVLRPDQQAWWRAARAWGVRGGVARSVEEALRLLEEAER